MLRNTNRNAWGGRGTETSPPRTTALDSLAPSRRHMSSPNRHHQASYLSCNGFTHRLLDSPPTSTARLTPHATCTPGIVIHMSHFSVGLPIGISINLQFPLGLLSLPIDPSGVLHWATRYTPQGGYGERCGPWWQCATHICSGQKYFAALAGRRSTWAH